MIRPGDPEAPRPEGEAPAAPRAVEAERDFLAAVLDSLEEGIVACDAEGRLSYFNGATLRLHGVPARSIPASEWASHYDLYRPDGVTPMPAEEIPLMRAFAGETVVNVPMVLARPGVEPRTLMATGRPITAEDGAPAGAVVAMRDVTDELRLRRELQLSAADTLVRLARAVEYRDGDTGAHLERMSRGCRLLAERVGFTEDLCTSIESASRLHDIGKLAVPDAVLLKAGKLNAAEWRLMEAHAVAGHTLLTGSDNEVLELAATIALSHHERIDGTGYPHGLEGASIPIEARIVAIADAFDALTSNRPYRRAFSRAEALQIMAQGRGTHFDAIMYDMFVEVLPLLESIETAAEVEPPPAWPVAVLDQSGAMRECMAESVADLHEFLGGIRAERVRASEGDGDAQGVGSGADRRQPARDRRWADDAVILSRRLP